MKKALIILFSLLYLSVAFVSTWHAITFFGLANMPFIAVMLALTFEIGQAAVLFTILLKESSRGFLSWTLMGVLTLVQVLGNVFSSYKYMVSNNSDQIDYFTNSVLFFVQSPNPEMNYVMISYITGAILPIVSLCMTAMVVGVIDSMRSDSKEPEKPKRQRSKKILAD